MTATSANNPVLFLTTR